MYLERELFDILLRTHQRTGYPQLCAWPMGCGASSPIPESGAESAQQQTLQIKEQIIKPSNASGELSVGWEGTPAYPTMQHQDDSNKDDKCNLLLQTNNSKRVQVAPSDGGSAGKEEVKTQMKETSYEKELEQVTFN